MLGHLDLDFTLAGQPAYAVISGDNGTRKSSIVDGREFAFVGRLLRASYELYVSHDQYAELLRSTDGCDVTVIR